MEIASLHWEFGRNWKAELSDKILLVGRVRPLEPQLDPPTSWVAIHDSELYGGHHAADTS